jgi:hypothetical protein
MAHTEAAPAIAVENGAGREMGEKTLENEQLEGLSPACSVEMERLALRQG